MDAVVPEVYDNNGNRVRIGLAFKEKKYSADRVEYFGNICVDIVQKLFNSAKKYLLQTVPYFPSSRHR